MSAVQSLFYVDFVVYGAIFRVCDLVGHAIRAARQVTGDGSQVTNRLIVAAK